MELIPCVFILTNTPASCFDDDSAITSLVSRKKSPPFGRVRAKYETWENEQSRKETSLYVKHTWSLRAFVG